MTESQPPQPGTPDRGMEKLNITVLVADDERAIRSLSKRLLESMGCVVTVVENGRQLKEELERNPSKYSLVITDNDMSEENEGLGVLRWIQSDDRFKHLPRILNSGKFSPELEGGFRDFGAVFLEKPYGRESFRMAVEKALGI